MCLTRVSPPRCGCFFVQYMSQQNALVKLGPLGVSSTLGAPLSFFKWDELAKQIEPLNRSLLLRGIFERNTRKASERQMDWGPTKYATPVSPLNLG